MNRRWSWFALISGCVALMISAASLQAEVIENKLGDTVRVPSEVNQPGRIEHIRSVVLLGVTKATIKGTWSTDDVDVLLNGNIIRIALLRPVEVPIGVLADNGLYYHILVSPTATTAGLNPVLTVVPAPSDLASAAAENGAHDDPQQVNGGHWEHEVNLVLKLQKHIRGGRAIAGVAGVPKFNQTILREEGKRVPGAIWHEEDDWKVVEYYEWTLDRVHAHYIGVTYRGRDDTVDFNYQQQATDHLLAIWHQDRPGDQQFYTRKLPQIRLTRGQEELFIEYTLDPQAH